MIPGIVAAQSSGVIVPPSVTYATWDPAHKHADIALSGGNLIASKSTGDALRSVRSTIGISGDKHYFEVLMSSISTSPFAVIGLGVDDVSTLSTAVGVSATSYGYYEDTGQKYNNNVLSAYGDPWKTDGIIVGVAVDATDPANKKIFFRRAGVWQNGGNPETGANPAFSGISGTLYVYLSLYRGSAAPKHQAALNSGQSTFDAPAPASYRAGLYQ